MMHLQKSAAFLHRLVASNCREWFDAHRDMYMEAKEEFEKFVNMLIGEIRLFDPAIGAVTDRDCVYRIYRDVRFSPDKTPYKNHFGAYIAQGGRKSELCGYYLHVEPSDAGYLDHSLWAGGVYSPDPATLHAVRTDIYEYIDEYKSIIEEPAFTGTFTWFDGNMLRTAPKGFPKDFPDIGLLKRRDYSFSRHIDDRTFNSSDLLEESVRIYQLMLPFNRFMNRAIQYHREQA